MLRNWQRSMSVCVCVGGTSRWSGLGFLVRGTELGLVIWAPLEKQVRGGCLPDYGSSK